MEPKKQAESQEPFNLSEVSGDRNYAKRYIAERCDYLRKRNIDRTLIASAMLDEIFKMLDGNPFRVGGDEAALTCDQAYLWRIKHRIVLMSELWDKGWLRLRKEKRPTFKFNRAAPRSKPSRAPRLQAPAPDYDQSQHRSDLIILRMRPGHVYTEGEVLTRYRRRMLRALGDRHVGGYDRVKGLAGAKKRILGWMRRTQHLITIRESA